MIDRRAALLEEETVLLAKIMRETGNADGGIAAACRRKLGRPVPIKEVRRWLGGPKRKQ